MATPMKLCGHNDCTLLISTCCACSDSRPYADGYPVYIDGVGQTNTGTRNQDYCPTCKAGPALIYAAHDLPSSTQSRQPQSESIVPPDSTGNILNSPWSHTFNYGAILSRRFVTKACGHSDCQLTTATCCACMDARPFMSEYPMFIDGRGLVRTGARHDHYCPGCRAFREPQEVSASASPPQFRATARPIIKVQHSRSLFHTMRGMLGQTLGAASSMGRSVATCLPLAGRTGTWRRKQSLKVTDEFLVDNACIMCYDKHREVLFEPCHHLAICESCADVLHQEAEGEQAMCPICRGEIDYYFRVFRA